MKLNRGAKPPLKNLNTSLPNMSDVLISWFQDIEFILVDRVVSDDSADIEPIEKEKIKTRGVVRPPSQEDLKLMPEGAWSWRWLQVHCLPGLNLQTNQFVKYQDTIYKVMDKKDYTEYGYIRYTLLEAYQAENNEWQAL